MDGQSGAEQPIRFEILGPVRAWYGAVEVDLGPSKQRAVLAVLLLNANKPVSTAQIIDAVWGDEPPENGPNVVQKYVAGLRRIMEPSRSPRAPSQLITRTDTGYQLQVNPEQVDADRFQALVRRARAARDGADATTARTLLSQAFGLWRGAALAGLTGPVFDAARTGLDEGRAAAWETWADLEVRHGEVAQVVPTLLRLVAEYPLREQLRYLLILALYQAGRQAEALAAYREARQFLAEEFGVEPGERLQELHRRMLRADPHLLALTPPAVAAPAAPPPVTLYPRPRHRAGLRWWQVVGKVLITLFPIVTFGLATWLVIAWYAVIRRSIVQGVAAVGYVAMLYVAFAGSNHNGDTLDSMGMLAFVVGALGGGLHAGILAWRPPGRHEAEQRVRRQAAAEIFRYSPLIARQLRIGRPDLPPAFDDGGVLDINTAPEPLIAALLGVTAQQAARIADARRVRGGLSSLNELVADGLVSPRTARTLRDVVVFAAPPDEPVPGQPTVATGNSYVSYVH